MVTHKKKGRPPKYRKVFASHTVHDYLDTCTDKDTKRIEIEGKITKFQFRSDVNLPCLEGFADYIEETTGMYVCEDTLTDWQKAYPPFLRACNLIKRRQRQRLIMNTLGGKYPTNFATFLLSANHDMRSKSDITSKDKPLADSPPGDGMASQEDLTNLAHEFDDKLEHIVRSKIAGSQRQPAHPPA